MRPFEKLQRYWTDEGYDFNVGPSREDAIVALEQRYRVTLPDDFREYLLVSCPQDGFVSEGYGTTWWELSRIKNVFDEYDHVDTLQNAAVCSNASRYIFFADYSAWAMAWAICAADTQDRGRIVVINGSDDRFVADSFAEFVEFYVLDVDSLL